MKKIKISSLKLTPHTIRLTLGNGDTIFDRVKLGKKVPYIGHYNLHKPVIRVDEHIKDTKIRKSILVHEAVERFLRRKGYGPLKAHHEAERIERVWALKHGVPWRKEGTTVEEMFRKYRKPGVRRRR
jgi:hypothetical protein